MRRMKMAVKSFPRQFGVRVRKCSSSLLYYYYCYYCCPLNCTHAFQSSTSTRSSLHRGCRKSTRNYWQKRWDVERIISRFCTAPTRNKAVRLDRIYFLCEYFSERTCSNRSAASVYYGQCRKTHVTQTLCTYVHCANPYFQDDKSIAQVISCAHTSQTHTHTHEVELRERETMWQHHRPHTCAGNNQNKLDSFPPKKTKHTLCSRFAADATAAAAIFESFFFLANENCQWKRRCEMRTTSIDMCWHLTFQNKHFVSRYSKSKYMAVSGVSARDKFSPAPVARYKHIYLATLSTK